MSRFSFSLLVVYLYCLSGLAEPNEAETFLKDVSKFQTRLADVNIEEMFSSCREDNSTFNELQNRLQKLEKQISRIRKSMVDLHRKVNSAASGKKIPVETADYQKARDKLNNINGIYNKLNALENLEPIHEQALRELMKEVINEGVQLFNKGEKHGCAGLYKYALQTMYPSFRPEQQTRISFMLQVVEFDDPTEEAFAYRRALNEVYAEIHDEIQIHLSSKASKSEIKERMSYAKRRGARAIDNKHYNTAFGVYRNALVAVRPHVKPDLAKAIDLALVEVQTKFKKTAVFRLRRVVDTIVRRADSAFP